MFNAIKMDIAISKKTIIIMLIAMIIVCTASLYLFTPIVAFFAFVVGISAVISGIFAVENKSNMDKFYNCMPVKRWEYVCAKAITSLLLILITSLIGFAFMAIGDSVDLCVIEEMKIIKELAGAYNYVFALVFIAMSIIEAANLLLVSFSFKMESREVLGLILLFIELVVIIGVAWVIDTLFGPNDGAGFSQHLRDLCINDAMTIAVILVVISLMIMAAAVLLSIKIRRREK